MIKRFEQPAGFYTNLNPEFGRAYYISGNRSGNFWIDLTLPEPE